MLENPVAMGEMPERRADWTCPHCGEEWARVKAPDGDTYFEGTTYTVAEDNLHGIGCCYACAEEKDDDEARKAYIEENDLGAAVIRQALGLPESNNSPSLADIYRAMDMSVSPALDEYIDNYLVQHRDEYRDYLMGYAPKEAEADVLCETQKAAG